MIVSGLVLAAGGGTRFGGPKAVARLDGETLVERAVRTLRSGGCDQVIAVLGAAVPEVPGADVVVVNPDWSSGLGSSLRVGLEAAAGVGGDAVVVMLVDQPRIGAEAVKRVVGAGRAGASLARASYGGGPGHPVLIGSEHWDAVMAGARGDRGAGPFLATHTDLVVEVPCGDVASPVDVDTRQQWAELTASEPPSGPEAR